ncbi:17677_t:CDS:1 [Cetraspora pellucida]|uniref:17677_t:CDS:1 n=1 Tax=Cetraspora pellucida TaxID=1433469 RepID=A0ACA9NW83_9GLOM|nr:17677_t:CDS:1 [Cetraspora pellucida]
MTKLGRKKWIPYTREEIEEEEAETQPTKKKKKPTDDIADLSLSEYNKMKEESKPVEKSYYLERIKRYRARKEREKAPIGSLTGLAIDKQKELADGLIKA